MQDKIYNMKHKQDFAGRKSENMNVSGLFHRHIIVTFYLLFISCTCIIARTHIPKYEVRAVWLTTIGGLDWPHSYARSEAAAGMQQQELCDILDRLKAANVNTVLLQTRIRGTVIYPSIYEPWDGCLSGIPGIAPGYDALKFAIDECHKRGMELHAWIVTVPVGKWNKEGCRNLRKRYPAMIQKIGDEGYMNPECDETAVYLSRLCHEITENYDVDGIHLDYIRYPETWKLRVSREQGRRNITAIVKRIHDDVKSIKPWVKISCSPIGKHDDLSRFQSYGWNARTKGCQDAQEWLRIGLMDELFPMMYFRGDQFYPFMFDWKENSYGRIISAGLGVYLLSSKEKNWSADVIERQMEVLRRHGIGHAYFRSKFFTDNTKGIYDFASGYMDCHPALVPPLAWESDILPLAPSMLDIKRGEYGDYLSWSGAQDMSDGPYLLYNIYASDVWPVDIGDAGNLIAVRYQHQDIFVRYPSDGPRLLHYAVTAVDRYGNESSPIVTAAPDSSYESDILLINNDGIRLELPEKPRGLDAGYVVIETLQGTMVALKPYRGLYADISDIPEGIYVLKSLGRKGVTHRMGYFTIKRRT